MRWNTFHACSLPIRSLPLRKMLTPLSSQCRTLQAVEQSVSQSVRGTSELRLNILGIRTHTTILVNPLSPCYPVTFRENHFVEIEESVRYPISCVFVYSSVWQLQQLEPVLWSKLTPSVFSWLKDILARSPLEMLCFLNFMLLSCRANWSCTFCLVSSAVDHVKIMDMNLLVCNTFFLHFLYCPSAYAPPARLAAA